MKSQQHLCDCDALPASKLRSKYKAEANSHRAMLDRRRSGAIVADELLEFRNFLRVMGVRPASGFTIDRQNSDDPEYALSKIQWRSKTDQSRNRRNVVVLKDSAGISLPLTEWAARTGQSRFTLHARRNRGLSDNEVIYGPSSKFSQVAGIQGPPHKFPWPTSKYGDQNSWERQYRATAWTYPGFSRPETRAAYLVRKLKAYYATLIEELDRDVDPNSDPGPEHDGLFQRLEVCRRELRKAVLLHGSAG